MREYHDSTLAVTRALGIQLNELPDWTCCGATSAHVTDDRMAFALAGRNVMTADKIGDDLIVPCAACYNRLKTAEYHLRAGDIEYDLGSQFSGKIHIKHLAEFLANDVGVKTIADKVKKPLTGLRPVAYYGCLVMRPPKVTGIKNYEDPQSMDNIMGGLGAETLAWSFKTDCCGAGHLLTQPEIGHTLIKKLLDMAEEAGADCIVTGCPMCQSNLDSPQHEMSHIYQKTYNTPVFLITELMGLAFGDPDADKWLSRHSVDPRPFLKGKGLL